MKVTKTKNISKNIALSIVEVDDAIAVNHFNERFQVVLEVNGKRIFPRHKTKFLEFLENDCVYTLKSDITDENVRIDEVLAHELLLCDRNELDCTIEIDELSLLDDNELSTTLHSMYKF